MMTDLSAEHVAITGAGSGIGAAIARRFAAAGAHVTLMGRNRDKLDETARSLASPGIQTVDVADERSVTDAFHAAAEGQGPVTVLVNNAGIAPSGAFAKMSLDDWRQVLDINLTGAFLCSRAVLPGMLAAGRGRIVNIASTAGLKGYPYVTAYVASKHGLVGLTRALALELAKSPITVNSICPGYTETDIVGRSVQTIMEKTGRSENEALKQLVKANPQGRLIQPDEVAALTVWLCGEDARSITGQSLAVAGGEVL